MLFRPCSIVLGFVPIASLALHVFAQDDFDKSVESDRAHAQKKIQQDEESKWVSLSDKAKAKMGFRSWECVPEGGPWKLNRVRFESSQAASAFRAKDATAFAKFHGPGSPLRVELIDGSGGTTKCHAGFGKDRAYVNRVLDFELPATQPSPKTEAKTEGKRPSDDNSEDEEESSEKSKTPSMTAEDYSVKTRQREWTVRIPCYKIVKKTSKEWVGKTGGPASGRVSYHQVEVTKDVAVRYTEMAHVRADFVSYKGDKVTLVWRQDGPGEITSPDGHGHKVAVQYHAGNEYKFPLSSFCDEDKRALKGIRKAEMENRKAAEEAAGEKK